MLWWWRMMATRVGIGSRLVVAVCISVSGRFFDCLQARCEELRTLVALDLACTHVHARQGRSVQTSLRVDI
jgi:hypothetical protein